MDQTYQDFELLLIDDESNKATEAILSEWEHKYPDKIRVIHQKNSGVYIAKYNGIRTAKGSYCYVMDDDDLIIHKTTFEEIRKVIEKTDSDLVIFNATDNKNGEKPLYNIPFNDNQIFENENLSLLYDHFLESQNLNHIWMMVFRRSLFNAEFEYKESFRMSRDGGYLIVPILTRVNKAIYLKKVFYYWRVQNPDSLSKHYDVLNYFYSVRELHRKILECSKAWNYRSSKTDELIRINYMNDICTTAMRVRGLSKSASISKKECLVMISEDNNFRNKYILKGLKPYRKVLTWALYHRQYWLIKIVFVLVTIVKKIFATRNA
jgi:Glycosyltransferases involved in cell wall biogenesis